MYLGHTAGKLLSTDVGNDGIFSRFFTLILQDEKIKLLLSLTLWPMVDTR
jgi:hypothetical protein